MAPKGMHVPTTVLSYEGQPKNTQYLLGHSGQRGTNKNKWVVAEISLLPMSY
jgi:hypothetical protein